MRIRFGLEIGCGKGRFILENARRNPEINFVAIEKEEGALIMATEKAVSEELPNLRFLSFDAAALNEIFAPCEISLIYLNFSDPWPPNRQRKRRLTWRSFLAVYDEILTKMAQFSLRPIISVFLSGLWVSFARMVGCCKIFHWICIIPIMIIL